MFNPAHSCLTLWSPELLQLLLLFRHNYYVKKQNRIKLVAEKSNVKNSTRKVLENGTGKQYLEHNIRKTMLDI